MSWHKESYVINFMSDMLYVMMITASLIHRCSINWVMEYVQWWVNHLLEQQDKWLYIIYLILMYWDDLPEKSALCIPVNKSRMANVGDLEVLTVMLTYWHEISDHPWGNTACSTYYVPIYSCDIANDATRTTL